MKSVFYKLQRSDPGADAGNSVPPGAAPVVARWLLISAGFVVAVLLVGGITRITHSGLSIAQWQPLVGALPPLSEADWEELFARYRATPEFRLVNFDMTLEGFQGIFWWEYAHRLLGRVAGLVFAVPLLWFLHKRLLPRRFAATLAAIFVLGALQGALGWYMVASGLVEDPRVSALRLTAHLALALLIIAALLWLAWNGWTQGLGRVPPLAAVAVAAVLAMALTGAMVAGTRAGLSYNTFPLMDGEIFPVQALQMQPMYRNFLANPAMIQFVHRAMACCLALLLPALWWRARFRPARDGARAAAGWMLAALVLQLGLGIATLLSMVALPLAIAHQAGAVLLFAATLRTAQQLGAAAAPPLAGELVKQRQDDQDRDAEKSDHGDHAHQRVRGTQVH